MTDSTNTPRRAGNPGKEQTMTTTRKLPDGRWAATVEPRPGVVVTAYGQTETEALANLERLCAAMEEHQ